MLEVALWRRERRLGKLKIAEQPLGLTATSQKHRTALSKISAGLFRPGRREPKDSFHFFFLFPSFTERDQPTEQPIKNDQVSPVTRKCLIPFSPHESLITDRKLNINRPRFDPRFSRSVTSSQIQSLRRYKVCMCVRGCFDLREPRLPIF